jgi:hypothetical protein
MNSEIMERENRLVGRMHRLVEDMTENEANRMLFDIEQVMRLYECG